ncbi:MAG: thiamine phosphate synthase [Candidatus Omnitrophica bacterium]|nr:thiamine phosphate synthase [Candidatus Omnitrophota bacterium]
MNWKRKFSKNGLLYVILDKEVTDKAKINIFLLADKLAYFGVDLFQLRAKGLSDKECLSIATKLSKIIQKRRKMFIVNDRADIAYLAGASGLHLGENDISPFQARKIIGKGTIIGKTIHSLGELKNLNTQERIDGAKIDYVSFGPTFKTKTKPSLQPLASEELKILIKKSKKLIFAIGGINQYNIDSLLDSGINNIAICRGIILAKNLKTTVNNYKKCLNKVS